MSELKRIREALDVVAGVLTGLYARLDALDSPSRDLEAPSRALSVPERKYGWRVDTGDRYRDAMSEVPEGYDTVLGYLAKYHPDVLDTLDYRDPEVTQRDGFKLAHWCRNECKPLVYVQAPPALQWCGIETVRAYPVELLERRWS